VDDLGDVVWYGSVLIPTMDAWPSTAINWASFDPTTGTVTFRFRSGAEATHACSIEQWVAYKASGSRGVAYNLMFRGR